MVKKEVMQTERATLILENDCLRAEIWPHDEGHLVFVVHKGTGRDFIWTNPRTACIPNDVHVGVKSETVSKSTAY